MLVSPPILDLRTNFQARVGLFLPQLLINKLLGHLRIRQMHGMCRAYSNKPVIPVTIKLHMYVTQPWSYRLNVKHAHSNNHTLTLMSQRQHDVMAHMHHCQQRQETIGHTRTQLHHKPQKSMCLPRYLRRDNSFCDMDTAMYQPK